MFREGLEVLRGGDEMAFVSCTGDASQAHTLEAMVGLEVRKGSTSGKPQTEHKTSALPSEAAIQGAPIDR